LFVEIVRIIEWTFPKSIVLKTFLPENLRTVFGDATQLYQGLLNLIVKSHKGSNYFEREIDLGTEVRILHTLTGQNLQGGTE